MQQEAWESLDRCALRAPMPVAASFSHSTPGLARSGCGPAAQPPMAGALSYHCVPPVHELIGDCTDMPACRPARDALFSAVRRMERLLLAQLAAANRRRLLDFARRLRVGQAGWVLHGGHAVGCRGMSCDARQLGWQGGTGHARILLWHSAATSSPGGYRHA